MERTITADAVPQAKTRTMTNFRWKIAFLIFLISFVAYMDRVNLSVATPVIMQEFGFDKMDMGFLQTCFFAGYALMQVPGGMLAERFGLRKTGAGAILWWSVFTALTAFAQGKASFAAVRLAFGLGEGPVFPSLGQATFNWFNKDEKGKASSAILLGTFFGPVIGPMVTVALIAALGWHAVFIIFGLAGCVLAWVWHRYAQDNPKDSPYVNEEEAAFINEGRSLSAERKSAPWGRFLRSRQFWALGIQFFVVDYIMYVFLAWLPLYLTEVHNLSLKSMGIWASFPWLALMAMVFTAGFLSDRMAHSKNSSRQYTMRTFTAMAGVAVTSLGLYIAAHTASGERFLRRTRLLHECQLVHCYFPRRQVHRLRIRLDEPLGKCRRRPRSDRHCILRHQLWLEQCIHLHRTLWHHCHRSMALRQSGQAARRDGRIIAFKRGCGKMVNHFATAFFCIGKAGISREGGVCLLFHK